MKKKLSKADLMRSFGVPEERVKMGASWLRYKSPMEKGIFWYFFSLYIRQRDIKKYGTCISCDRPITMENSNAGHFMPAEDCGRDLLFDDRNVNAECQHCNAWDSTHLLGYAENLDRRYGPGTAMKLRSQRATYKASRTPIKDWNRAEYSRKIEEIKLSTGPLDNNLALG